MSERTASEREQARREREARRAEREGRQAPVEAPGPAEPVQASEPAPPVREDPVAERPAPPEPPPPFERRVPPAAPTRRLPRQQGGVHLRRSAAERRAAATEFLRHRRERPGRRPQTGAARPILIAAGGVLALVAGWFLLSVFQPFHGDGEGKVNVTIPKGASADRIGEILEQRGVISSAFFFRMRLAVDGGAAELKPGAFELRRDMSHADAIEAISTAPKPDVVTLTIPEGLSREEAKGVVDDSLRGDYLAASRRSSRLDPRDFGGKGAKSLEGFLFPATYELKSGRHVRELVDRQLEAFEREIAGVSFAYAKRKNLTVYDVLTIASMVEREAMQPRERRLVASVIYNRLSEGMHLGIDATIRFAVDNWTEPLTQSQLATSSPYNTRTNLGLPPGPIGSPGIAAIRAAARPAKTDYLFYVVEPGTCGEHSFSATEAEFQQDVARYNAERERRGGKSPTDC